MKPLLPTLKERNRYVLVVSFEDDFYNELLNKFQELYGKILLGKANLKLVKFVPKDALKNYSFIGIVKVERNYMKYLLSTLIFLNARAFYVSGTLKKLREKIKNDQEFFHYFKFLKSSDVVKT